jgi:hypothetical protein
MRCRTGLITIGEGKVFAWARCVRGENTLSVGQGLRVFTVLDLYPCLGSNRNGTKLRALFVKMLGNDGSNFM